MGRSQRIRVCPFTLIVVQENKNWGFNRTIRKIRRGPKNKNKPKKRKVNPFTEVLCNDSYVSFVGVRKKDDVP